MFEHIKRDLERRPGDDDFLASLYLAGQPALFGIGFEGPDLEAGDHPGVGCGLDEAIRRRKRGRRFRFRKL